MKSIKRIALALLVSTSAIAQNHDDVSALLDEYADAMIDREWAKSLDYVYPALFDVVPREIMEQAISTTFNDTSVVKMGFKSLELLEVSDIYEEEELSYSFADYGMVMTMTSVGNQSDAQIETLRSAMAMQFGEESIEVKGRTLYITVNNKMAVIRKSGEDKLYMLEIKDELKQVMQSFMSETFMRRAFES